MPYTLMKGLLWVLLALLLGIVIGWLLRSVAAQRQISRARAQGSDPAEVERLRGRISNLEAAIADRDRLQAELDGAAPGDATIAPVGGGSDVVAPTSGGSPPAGNGDSAPGAVPVSDAGDGDGGGDSSPTRASDVGAAADVLGAPIVLDDLKVVEGVGPMIEELCHGIGIRTWYDLSITEVSLLRTMLNDAGPRFRTHDPSTWPHQAGLLAEGRWTEFKALNDELQGGRAAD